VIYIAFASHGDTTPYHGWVFGYDASTLKQVSVFCTTPNGLTDPSGYPIGGGGIWQAGGGVAADPDGNLYVITGNGTFDADASLGSGIDYGDSFVKLTTAGAERRGLFPRLLMRTT
jgi:DNA-binding beta-propeller fold protein YncE